MLAFLYLCRFTRSHEEITDKEMEMTPVRARAKFFTTTTCNNVDEFKNFLTNRGMSNHDAQEIAKSMSFS